MQDLLVNFLRIFDFDYFDYLIFLDFGYQQQSISHLPALSQLLLGIEKMELIGRLVKKTNKKKIQKTWTVKFCGKHNLMVQFFLIFFFCNISQPDHCLRGRLCQFVLDKLLNLNPYRDDILGSNITFTRKFLEN